MLKVLRDGLLGYILHTCNPCSRCYGMDCFGTYFTRVQSRDVTRVQSATEWTASVHTSHMSKAVMQPVFKPVMQPVGRTRMKRIGKGIKTWIIKDESGCSALKNKKSKVFFLDFQLWNHRFPAAKRQFSSWSHGPATRNTCASTSGLFKSTTNTTFQVPELRITKKRNVVHARAPYQPATLF